jgi:hypothetical protein
MKPDVKRVKEAARAAVSTAKWVNAKIDRACEATFPNAPQEVKSTAAGIATGLAAGAAIGGIGVAALGGAVGVSGAAALAVVGGLVGNRIGISKDRRAQNRRADP